MKPIQVYLTSKEHQELKVLAAQEGTTLSALIREALGYDAPKPIEMAYDPINKTIAGKPIGSILETTPVAEDEEEALLPLEIDPANKKRAWDPNIEEWVKV